MAGNVNFDSLHTPTTWQVVVACLFSRFEEDLLQFPENQSHILRIKKSVGGISTIDRIVDQFIDYAEHVVMLKSVFNGELDYCTIAVGITDEKSIAKIKQDSAYQRLKSTGTDISWQEVADLLSFLTNLASVWTISGKYVRVKLLVNWIVEFLDEQTIVKTGNGWADFLCYESIPTSKHIAIAYIFGLNTDIHTWPTLDAAKAKMGGAYLIDSTVDWFGEYAILLHKLESDSQAEIDFTCTHLKDEEDMITFLNQHVRKHISRSLVVNTWLEVADLMAIVRNLVSHCAKMRMLDKVNVIIHWGIQLIEKARNKESGECWLTLKESILKLGQLKEKQRLAAIYQMKDTPMNVLFNFHQQFKIPSTKAATVPLVSIAAESIKFVKRSSSSTCTSDTTAKRSKLSQQTVHPTVPNSSSTSQTLTSMSQRRIIGPLRLLMCDECNKVSAIVIFGNFMGTCMACTRLLCFLCGRGESCATKLTMKLALHLKQHKLKMGAQVQLEHFKSNKVLAESHCMNCNAFGSATFSKPGRIQIG